ncbi:exodeoxyribonuclease III [Dokdonella sp.]|uniref:exodeoxyribonuclease III n=1 Tax=Dokdonella sp. TaxID=2291710 RepID=UPI0031CAA8C1|nr:exodeoxyribonuclease III [Dokdonella sp.]
MRILTFNANGIRSAANKGFFDWLATERADVVCVQETKAQEHQLADAAFRPDGHHCHYRDATTRKGYSGVAIYARRAPDEVRTRLGWASFDEEGRYVEARFGKLSVVSLYLPSGSSGAIRQGFKFEVMAWLKPILDGWLASGRDYVLCGDWNIVRSELDIRNWKSNQKNSGCLPAERDWLNGLCGPQGWVDSYRHLRPTGQDYTWWSNRGAARANDVGWRIDYQLVSPGLAERLRDCAITREPRFSDHAPYRVDFA